MPTKSASLVIVFLLVGMSSVSVNVQSVGASGTIYIHADGSIDPPTAPILTTDNVTYFLTHNITGMGIGIVVEKDDIVIDGRGSMVQETGERLGSGIDLSGRSNVTVKNINIENFFPAISLDFSSGNNIFGNNIARNNYGLKGYNASGNSISGNRITGNDLIGIYLCLNSSYNNISENNITGNNAGGIELLFSSSHNRICGNEITNDGVGIMLDAGFDPEIHPSSYNDICGNNITNNHYGIYSIDCPGNTIFHNNFINNSDPHWEGATQFFSPWSDNVLDCGYPSGGNYWSDYVGQDEYHGPYQNETGSDGIGDTPNVIVGFGVNNSDNYPLMQPHVSVFGDINQDGIVDISDAVLIAAAFGSYPEHPRWGSLGDFNQDNTVDIFDIIILASNFGRHYP